MSAMPQKKMNTYLALGDSYTIGESVPASERYPVQTVKLLESEGIYFGEPEIIATTGWTTADLLSAVNKTKFAQDYDIVTLLIGVNNQYQGRSKNEYEREFSELLNKSIQLAGNRPGRVVVLSIPDYSITPFAHSSDTVFIAAEIDSFNLINRKIASEHHVHYIDITIDSRKAASDPTLIANDGLHFSGKEYAVWAAKLGEFISKIINKE